MREKDASEDAGHRSALDAVIEPVATARPVLDAHGDVVDFVFTFLNPAARAWAAALGIAMVPGARAGESTRIDAYRDVYRTGTPLSADGVAVATLDGAPGRLVDLRVSRVGDELLLTWRDVTERARAEAAVAESEARFRSVLENLDDAAILCEPVVDGDRLIDLETVFVNHVAGSWGNAVGRRMREGCARWGVPWLYDRHAQAYVGQSGFSDDDVTVLRPDGVLLNLEVRARRIDHALLVTWRDVSARKRFELELADSETRFRMAFDDAPVGMTIASLVPEAPSRLLQVNHAFAAMLGYEPHELVGTPAADLVHPSEQDVDRALLDELVAGLRDVDDREKRLRRADGTWLWVRMITRAVRSDDGPATSISHTSDVTAKRAVEAKLARRALFDPLTGLANRALLLDHLRLAAAELDRASGSLAVLYLDLDRFKDVNDTLGHEAGDHVLQEVATRLSGAVRSGETVGRLAGDEFVVVAHVDDDLDAARIAERLVDAVSGPMDVLGRRLVIRPSVGVTTTQRYDASPDELLREADLAMYQAKHHGRQPWALYDATLQRLALERLAVEEDLRSALQEGWLRLEYQPVLDLVSGEVVGAEALLRIEHPEKGTLHPAHFIAVAEDTQVIVPIGAWVLERAATDLAAWRAVRPDATVSVNIAARQVHQLALRGQVAGAAALAGVDPSGIALEMTERVLLEGTEDVLEELGSVTALGCDLAIDDFGTGFSSLAHLTSFPVTSLKIDRSFVAGLGVRDQDGAIVAAVLGLAESLGLHVVAEGVETAEQLAILRQLGCTRAQGFHLARPTTAEAVLARLARDADARSRRVPDAADASGPAPPAGPDGPGPTTDAGPAGPPQV